MQYKETPYAQFHRSLTSHLTQTNTDKGWSGRRLLLELANLPDPIGEPRLRRIAWDFPEVFGRFADDDDGLKELLDILGRFLRLAWNSKGRERSWHLFTLRQEYLRGMLGQFAVLTRSGKGGRDVARKLIPGVPPKTLFDSAVYYAQEHLSKKMAVCARGKACGAPYFFRRRKGQRYCGTDCRAVALKERSDRWWAKNGKRWRADWLKRKKEESSKSSVRRKARSTGRSLKAGVRTRTR